MLIFTIKLIAAAAHCHFKKTNLFDVYAWVSERLCAHHPFAGVGGSQKTLDPLELSYKQLWSGNWTLGLLQEQPVLVTTAISAIRMSLLTVEAL